MTRANKVREAMRDYDEMCASVDANVRFALQAYGLSRVDDALEEIPMDRRRDATAA